MQPVDFHEVIASAKKGGGFEDYPQPLCDDITHLGLDPDIKVPSHPGELAYSGAIYRLAHNQENIPQSLINAQNLSFRDAMRLFTPPRALSAHMCSFFRKDFLHSPAFLSIEKNRPPVVQPAEDKFWGDKSANDTYSFDYANSERKSTNRVYYTDREMHAVEHVCKEVPALRTTVLAYQAGFIDYLGALGKHIVTDDNLSLSEQERGKKIIETLKTQLDSNNFLDELLPAICLAYHRRDPDLKEPVIDQDFEQGFKLAIKFGVFRHDVVAPDGGTRKFTCPAHITIGAVSTKSLDGDAQPHFPQGHMLGMICRRVLEEQRKLAQPTAQHPTFARCPMSRMRRAFGSLFKLSPHAHL